MNLMGAVSQLSLTAQLSNEVALGLFHDET